MPRACIFFFYEVLRFFKTSPHIVLSRAHCFYTKFYRAKSLDQFLAHTKTGLCGINSICSLSE